MRMIFGLVLVIGVGLAACAVYLAQNYVQSYQAALQRERAASRPNIETVDVYVAQRPLAYGEPITPKDVKLVAFPEKSLPKGVFHTEAELFPKGVNVPRAALRAIEGNEAIMTVKVTAPGENAGIAAKLERGMRAFAIKVDSTSGVSGFLRPGDRVDIYWTGNLGRGGLRTEANSTGNVTKLIESGVQLIAVDQSANADLAEASVARTVTVSVRPEQVAALAQAQATGRLSLSLVGLRDDTIASAIEIDQRQLLDIASAPVQVQAPKAEVCTVRTRRGADVIETPIPCTN